MLEKGTLTLAPHHRTVIIEFSNCTVCKCSNGVLYYLVGNFGLAIIISDSGNKVNFATMVWPSF